MRELALATFLAGILIPATLSAQPDGGLPDGMAGGEPHATQMDDHHTGYSSDPNGNMGDEGRTGRDAGAADAPPNGAEGTSGQDQRQGGGATDGSSNLGRIGQAPPGSVRAAALRGRSKGFPGPVTSPEGAASRLSPRSLCALAAPCVAIGCGSSLV